MDQFNSSESISTLREMAAHAAALNIWIDYFSRFQRNPYEYARVVFEIGETFLADCDRPIRCLRLPKSIENTLKAASRNVHNKMNDWIFHFELVVFGGPLISYLYRLQYADLNRCVWSSDFKVDYAKSALKILSAAQLSEIQRFIIICKYCLAHELVRFPLEFLDSETTNILMLRANPLLNFWICVLNREALRMPVSLWIDHEFVFRGLQIIPDIAMSVYCWYGDRLGFDFFWNRLTPDLKVTIASRIIQHKRGERHMKLMLKLSPELRQQLICEIPVVIMKHFIVRLNAPQNAVSCWTQAKDLMTEEQFHILVLGLFEFSKYDLEANHAEKCHKFLVHVWDTASGRLKSHVLEVTIASIFREFFEKNHQHSASGLKFLYGLLSLKSVEYRRNLMLRNAVPFAVNVPVFDPRLTTDLIELCVPDDHDRLEFERVIMASNPMREHLKISFYRGKLGEIRMKLDIFSSKNVVASAGEFKRMLLTRGNICLYVERFLTDLSRWNELNRFINEAFENDSSSASNFKNKLLVSFAEDRCTEYWFPPYNMNEIIEIVNCVLPPEEVKVFKRTTLNSLRELIFSGRKSCITFEKNNFLRNLKWCLGNEEEVREFVNRLPANKFNFM